MPRDGIKLYNDLPTATEGAWVPVGGGGVGGVGPFVGGGGACVVTGGWVGGGGVLPG